MNNHPENCPCPACVAQHGPVGGLSKHDPIGDMISAAMSAEWERLNAIDAMQNEPEESKDE
jgi:hypothetical protein